MKLNEKHAVFVLSLAFCLVAWVVGTISIGYSPRLHVFLQLASFLVFGLFFVLFWFSVEQANRNQKLSEQKYSRLFDLAPVGIGIADLDGNVLEANRGMAQITGYSLDEFKKINVASTYVHAEDRQRLIEELWQKGEVRDWPVRLRRKDGRIYFAMLNVDRVKLGGQEVLLTIQRDVTGLDQLVKDRTAELEEINRKLENEIVQHQKDEDELRDKVKELQVFFDAAVGRELKMAELEKEIEGLKKRAH